MIKNKTQQFLTPPLISLFIFSYIQGKNVYTRPVRHPDRDN